MADVLTPQQRSFNMSRIRNRDTRPELVVRSIVHRLGYRYRLHKKDLPGKPDLVLVRHRKIIDVHGCFFHMHKCRYGSVVPATNAKFWRTKRLSNVERDRRNLRALRRDGWRVMIVWECETRDLPALSKRIETFLSSNSGDKSPHSKALTS
ncbi:MAG TPA: DNA mismatch endonuclease Vsr [Pyrinomonadaceae bacterium]|nr:DNA mismatch endonuclease Vsr [Pyrinomonadaceae bacterium]